MKETIILSNLNEKELLKTFALNGVGSFNVRVFNAEGLAKEASIRNGNVINQRQISTIEQECAIYNISKEIDYFKDISFLDAKNINEAITYARKLCRGSEEDKIETVFFDGEFREKNLAILEVYKEYKQYLTENNLIDSIEIINNVIKNHNKIDAEFVTFLETSLEPLEEELIKVASNNNYGKKTIREFVQKENKQLANVTYANAYGSVNEVEYILGYIAKNNIRYDDCVIALLDNSYAKHFINYRDTYDIPMTFGVGQDLSLSNSFKVLTLLDRWNKQYNAINSLNELINASEFNTNKFWSAVF
ncbi:MAG: hypothetical protein KBT35_07870, partial [Firmicutes bacterium]|nr:hypothetical protein [Candidatus Colivicinus equi]